MCLSQYYIEIDLYSGIDLKELTVEQITEGLRKYTQRNPPARLVRNVTIVGSDR